MSLEWFAAWSFPGQSCSIRIGLATQSELDDSLQYTGELRDSHVWWTKYVARWMGVMLWSKTFRLLTCAKLVNGCKL